MTTSSFISEDLSISGDIEFSDELVIAGSVNGTVNCNGDDDSVVKVVEGGQLVGEINAPVIEIFGHVEATVVGSVSVSVGPTATVTGVLRFKQLQVSPGALITGELIPIGESEGDEISNIKQYQKSG